MKRHYRRLTLAAALLALAVPHTPANAQPQRASQEGLLEELVVTARKREQNLQDVAVGVSLLTGKALAEAQLRNAADLSTLIPTLNVQASSGPATSSFNIRGIGTQAFSTAVEPSVSTMLDGVVMSNSGMAFLELADIERVEVLRGPQGTLYGKNASGGVIHIITRDPTPEFSGTVSATAIEDDEYRVNATFSGPLSDSLGYRITGSALNDDGYAENHFNGNRINSAENYTLRGKLLWTASDDLELEWSSDFTDTDCDCNSLSVRAIRESPQQAALLAEQLPVVPADDNQDVNNDQPTFNKTRASGHSLTLDWVVAEHVLTSISAWREWDYKGIVDLDNRPSNPLALTFNTPPHNDVEQLSSTNIALFGEVNYNLSDDWQLTLGARYTQDKLKYRTSAVGTDNLVFGPEGMVDNSLNESDISPKIALQWNITDAAMAYVSYVSGYKGPAFDTSIVAGGREIAAETSDAYEVGLKSAWLDNRLILNVTAFYAEYTDFQAQALVDEDPNDLLPEAFLLVNAGEVSTRGVELEFIARPLDQWSITGGVSYTDGSIDDYPAGNCSAGQKFRGECPLGFQDLSGGQLPYTPEWKFNLSTDYRYPLDSLNMELNIGADLRAQDDVLFEISQDKYTRQDAYAVLDLRAGITGTESGYRVTAFVKNLLDESYATLIYAQAAELIPHGYIHSVPKYANRTLGVELRYDF